MTDYPMLIAVIQMVTALATLGGIVFGAVKINRTDKNMKLLELNTNSMKDALVAATATGEFAKGNLQGREQQTAERAVEKSTEAVVEKAVENAVEKVADKSLDTVAGKVADKVAEVMEKKS